MNAPVVGRSSVAMDAALSRRLWITLGGTVLVIAAGLAAALLVMTASPRSTAPPPASTGGLVVTASSLQPNALDPARPLRCFVGGQMIGEMTVADCAQRNGVATDNPDPPVQIPAPPPAAPAPIDAAASDQPAPLQQFAQADPSINPTAGVGDCRQFAQPDWVMVGAGMSLQGCVKLLFDGRCMRGPGASYGRWGGQTLRQQAGEVDISPDNRDFRLLVAQAPNCRIQDF